MTNRSRRSEQKKLASNVRELMIQHWNVPEPRLIISVTGGAGSFSMNKTLGDNFKKGLVEAAEAAGEFMCLKTNLRNPRIGWKYYATKVF